MIIDIVITHEVSNYWYSNVIIVLQQEKTGAG